MESTRIGRTGLQVSRIALGGMNFGSEIKGSQVLSVLERAYQLGITFFDTADVYPVPPDPLTWGASETLVGQWLKGKRETIVLASKCGNRVGLGDNDIGGSRKHIVQACEDSLRRLGTDRLDVYYLHKPELRAPIDESLEALDRLIQDGKILYFGLSKFSPWQLAIALESIAESRLEKVAVIQDRYSLVARYVEQDVFPLAHAKGIGIVAYGPLGGGLLAGAVSRGQKPPATGRFAMKLYQDRYLQDDIFEMAEAIARIAQDLGVSSAQVSLAWLFHQRHDIIPLIGAMSAEHVTDCVKALDLILPDSVLQTLNDLSSPYLGYPTTHHEVAA